MAEQLVNDFTVNRPIDEAWAVITDVERIAPCLPGAQLQEIEGEIYRGVVKIKLGSISPSFKGQATFVERDDVAHRAVLKAEGRDTGGRGNASAEIEAQAESLSPTSTRVVVTTDLHITGKVAQFGRGIIGDVSKKLMAQFAGNLNTMLDEQPSGGGDQASGPEQAAAEQASADEAASDGRPDAAATSPVVDPASTGAPAAPGEAAEDPTPPTSALGSDTPSESTPPAAEAPKVRKIDSPASEPVDLAGVAGPAILKRVAPLVAGLLLLVFVLRRRR
jgi:carbon monoxide dehydrogenase subunit G